MGQLRCRRAGQVLALVFVAILALAACGGGGGGGGQTDTGGEAGTPVSGGDLIDLQNFAQGEPDHIEPGLSSTIQGSQPGQLVWDGLTENDYQNGELKPMVAESWTNNADATQFVFKLRKNVTWSDGTPVLPSDFVRGWNRVVQKQFASEVAYHFDVIKGKAEVDAGKAKTMSGLKADDANLTLTVDLVAPYSTFATTTSHLVFSPIHKEVEKLKDQTKYEQGVMIGNGPYKLAEPWKHERYIKLVRNDNYWGGLNNHKAYLNSVEFRISKDVDSAFSDFEAGTGQTGFIPPGRFAEVKAKYAGRVSDKSILGVYWWGFNMKDPVVGGAANLKLRQAIAYAIDKQAIVNSVYNGSRQVATAFTPPGLPGYKEEGLNPLGGGRDLNKAKQLLAEWGGAAKITKPIKLNFGAGAGHEPVATIIQANLKELGINAELAPGDTETYFTQMRQGKGQFLRSGWIWDYVSYDNGMYPLFHSNSIGGDNLVQYSNPAFDKLVDEARATTDQAKANELYNQAEQAMLTDVAVVPLNWYTGQVAYSEQLKNVIQSPLDFFAYDEMWLQQ
jgi:oligopeptide transport system substrate-binding protein